MQKKFLIFKIIGFCLIPVFVGGIVLVAVGMGDFETPKFMIGGFMTCFGLFGCVVCLIMGFRPEMTKHSINTARHIQNENKDVLADIMTTNAEISKEAIKSTASAIKEGLSDNVFCKACGKPIDADSKFCRHCGTEQ